MATQAKMKLRQRSRAVDLASALTARPVWPALVLVAAITCTRSLWPVDADVSWQLWAAHQMNGGARLYRDIMEINPPLWFWMGMPVDALAQLLHLRSADVLIASIGGLAALAIGLTDRLVLPLRAQKRLLLLLLAALVLVALPWLEFGQREHLALIAALPYAALIAARRNEQEVPTARALSVGLGAALGFALKHYFLLVPCLLELWLVTAQGRRWRPFRPETLAMAAVGLLYAAAIAIWSADYFTRALPLIFASYSATGAERIVDLFQPAVLVAIAAVGLLISQPRLLRSQESGLAAALVVAGIGFAAAYFIQAKGWSYHALPFAACAALGLTAALLSSKRKQPLMLVAAPALLMLPFWISAQQALRGANAHPEVREALVGLRPNDAVAFIGTDPSLGWPDTLDRGLGYPSRYSSYWMMRAIVRNELRGSPDPRLSRLGKRIVEETVHDYRCLPPRRIIAARPSREPESPGAFDVLSFFQRNPHFVQLLGHYQSVSRTSVETFELRSALPPPPGGCVRRIP